MATIPIHSPVIPFLGLIPGGLNSGRMLRIKGILNKHGERCQIHIQSGAALSPRDDVALHISIRPNEYTIVRNTIKNQVVGPEERHGGCPVRYGEPFDLLILAEGGQFKLAFNGLHFCTFAHRLPLHNARFIAISGGCVIYSITYEHDSMPYQPNVPPSYPHAIGFTPNVPPMSAMPPPPPYTPLPTHPIGGGGGHYKDMYLPPPPAPPMMAAGYPPPPPPPMAGYPHHPPAPYQRAVPFSEGSRSQLGKLKESLAGGFHQTQDFLRDAIGKKPNQAIHTHNPSAPLGVWAPVAHSAPPLGQQYYGGSPSAPATVGAVYPSPAATGSRFPVPVPAGPMAPMGNMLSSLPKGKQKKLLKYGAAAGLAGLGGYALAKGIRRKSGSSSSSSSSDSD